MSDNVAPSGGTGIKNTDEEIRDGVLNDATKFAGADVDTIKTYIESIEHEKGFPTEEALNDISATGEQATTEKTVPLSLPAGAVLKKASLMTIITAMNNTASAQKMDITVQARKGAGAFGDYFSQDDIIGFGAVDGSTTSLNAISDITALIDDLGATYGFRCSINQSSANSVRYTIQHVLIICYALS